MARNYAVVFPGNRAEAVVDKRISSFHCAFWFKDIHDVGAVLIPARSLVLFNISTHYLDLFLILSTNGTQFTGNLLDVELHASTHGGSWHTNSDKVPWKAT